jgi:hypothetical protein
MEHVNPRISWRKLAPAAFALLAVYAACVALVLSRQVARSEALATGVVIDLTLSAAVLVYCLAVRPGWLRPARLVSVVWLGIGLAKLLVPGSWVMRHVVLILGPALEATVVLLALRSPLLRRALRSEGEALAFGLGGWFRRSPAAGYSFVRGRPWAAVVGVIAFLVLVETSALHFVLVPHSRLAAWIATGSSLYALAWIAGDYHALRLGGLVLGDTALALRFGLRWRAEIPWTLVTQVAATDAPGGGAFAAKDGDLLSCRVLRVDVLLTLREPVVAYGPFGLRRSVCRIALAVDAPERFVADVRQRMRLAAPADGS